MKKEHIVKEMAFISIVLMFFLPFVYGSLITDNAKIKIGYNQHLVIDKPSNIEVVLTQDGATDMTTSPTHGGKNILLKKGGISIVNFSVNFTQDINLSDVIADINVSAGKSVVHINKSKHSEIVTNYTLRIPVISGTGTVYLCPNAESISDVNLFCQDLYWVGGLTNHGGYYYVPVSGTGGAEGDGSQNESMVEKVGSYALKLNSSGGKVFGQINDQTLSYPVSTPTTWHHYALTYNGSIIKLFIDGQQVASQAYSSAITDNSNPVWLGDYFSGFIDDVRIYNTSLSNHEINKLYLEGINKRENTIVSNETTKGDVWKANVCSSDNIYVGTCITSNELTISNDEPTLTSITESNDPIAVGKTQNITPSGIGDADQDNLYLYCCNDTLNSCTPSSSLNVCNEGSFTYPYSNAECTFTVPSMATGTLYVRCRSYDGTIYSSTTASTSFTVDSSAPIINVGWDRNYVNGIINFNATATDDAGLKDNSCFAALNNSAPSWEIADDNFSNGDLSGFCNETFDTTTLSDGLSYDINFKVNDTADNQGSNSKSVYVCNEMDTANCGNACVDAGYHYNGTGFNSFDFEGGNANCCGDDASEYYINTSIDSTSYDACCDNSGDCVDQTGTCRDNVTESGATCNDGIDNDCDGYIDSADSDCCPTIQGGLFMIKNGTQDNCTLVDTDGDVAIKGSLSQSCSSSPGNNDFVIKSGSNVLMWVNHSSCNVCLKGTISQEQSSITPGSNEFLIKNGTTNYVVKIDNSGNLYTTGNVGSGCNI